MRSQHQSRLRNDEGATAVLVAVLTVLLFLMAALAVDLGNALTRRAAVQNVADQAARDAAAALVGEQAASGGSTSACGAVRGAFGSLTAAVVQGGTAPTAVALTDADLSNGEVVVRGPDGADPGDAPDVVDLDPCDDDPLTLLGGGTQVTVVPPEATVDFGLAAVAGYDSVNVSAQATAEVRSALPVLPFAVPAACVAGDPRREGPAVLQAGVPAITSLLGCAPVTGAVPLAALTPGTDDDVHVPCPQAPGSRCVEIPLAELPRGGGAVELLRDRMADRPPPCEPPAVQLGDSTLGGFTVIETNTAGCYGPTPDFFTGDWRFTESSVTTDPRLFLVPVVGPQQSGTPLLAIPPISPTVLGRVEGYLVAYVTSEGPPAWECPPLVSCENGVAAPPSGDPGLAALDSIRVQLFSPGRLPPDADVVGNGHPYAAGAGLVQLVG